MARINRKIKRELARSLKARSLRESKLTRYYYDMGLASGIDLQKAKVDYSTLGMEYLYEYPVEGTSVADSVDVSNVGGIKPGVSSSSYD